MNLPEVKIEDLLEAGVHFGHNVRRWNPKMENYIFGVRNNIHIFDLRITLEALNNSLVKIHETVSKSGKILFVGTKKQCSESVKELAESTNNFFVNKRWLGGTLTNWKTISNSINRLNELEWIDGKIWANIWMTPFIVVVDPATGNVTSVIDCRNLVEDARASNPDIDVLNGIAWDATNRELYLTGKLWPWIYQVVLDKKPSP